MIAIRGATTIDRDDKDEIRSAIKELLEAIEEANGLLRSEIVCIVFSSTSDIHSYYPAKAAREAGFECCSLFSTTEPEIEGSLPLCLRVMIFIEKNLTPHHVYLRGAKGLRRDLSKKITIAIDGPAGSGKSTVARILAKDYKILYLDTGAMYRACALAALRNHVDCSDEAAVCELLKTTDLSVRYENGDQQTFLGPENVSALIRTPEVSMAASTVSKYPCVRMKLVEKQREIASKISCVLDGRDIGSFVLPNADYKFFLTASVEVRAKRRYDESIARGESVTLEQIQADIVARDLQDSTRQFSPLKKAEDAIEVDTSNMTVEEVLAYLKHKIQERI